MKRRAPLLLLAAALLLPAATLAVGCGTAATSSGGGSLDVVASVSYLADIAQNVAGDRFEVRSLVPLETDPHAFEPTPSDLGEVAGADVVIVNGGGLEGPLLGTLENAGGDATIVEASAGLESRRPQPGEPPLDETGTDPHFWLDPTLVKTYVENIRDAFAEADPKGAAEYAANAAAYSKKLDELDAWIETQIAQIPPADRKLVVNHASHGYFADRYGLEIVGAVIPGVSTEREPDGQTTRRVDGGPSARAARRRSSSEIDEDPEARAADRRRDRCHRCRRPARPFAERAGRGGAHVHRDDEVRHARIVEALR